MEEVRVQGLEGVGEVQEGVDQVDLCGGRVSGTLRAAIDGGVRRGASGCLYVCSLAV